MKRNIVTKAFEFMRDPDYRFKILASMGMYNKLDDETFLKKYYQCIFHKELDLQTPKTFNAKLQWLKLYDRRPEYTMMVDKYRVRDYIAEKIGSEYLIPLLGVWDNPDEIDFDSLPQKFVLKCNHNSGLGMCICKDKSKLDVKKAKADLRKGLEQDYYITLREWPYKDVPRKIICEKYMEDSATTELRDYKLFCFNGEPKATLICSDRFTESGLHEDFYNELWEKLPVKRPNIPVRKDILERPVNFETMKSLAQKLAENMPFVRTDFYEINGEIYFGELTFFPASGFSSFDPEYWDQKFGEWITLPEKLGGYINASNEFVFVFKEKNISDYNNGHVSKHDLIDYKFFCFDGCVDCVMVCLDRSNGNTKFYFFDRAWNLLRYNIRGKEAPEDFTIPKPSNIEEMFEIAEKLSEGLPFARIDLYSVSGRTYFGEITFFPDSGFDVNLLPETDRHWGKMINISNLNSEV